MEEGRQKNRKKLGSDARLARARYAIQENDPTETIRIDHAGPAYPVRRSPLEALACASGPERRLTAVP